MEKREPQSPEELPEAITNVRRAFVNLMCSRTMIYIVSVILRNIVYDVTLKIRIRKGGGG